MDHKDITARCKTLVIFKDLLSDPAVSALLGALENAGSDRGRAAEYYCEFIAELYKHGEDLTDHIVKRVLENENIYIVKKGAGEQTGKFLDECLQNELYALTLLSQIDCRQLTEAIGGDIPLPRFCTHNVDLKEVYADRVRNIDKCGYGIYARDHVFLVENGRLVPVEYPDPISLAQLSGYQRERGEVIENTLALLGGRPANNVLLYGDCGTGKSSTVKAIANEYAGDGLRLIELKKKQLHELPAIVRQITANPLKFIIFIDDLSFTEDDEDFAALKAILEGGVSCAKTDNLCIYATSNRRHLVRETFSARKGDEIHFNDTMQELLSLSDRFGLTVTFVKPDKKLYLEVVESLAEQYGIKTPIDEVKKGAETFALSRAGRSPRVAKQYIEYLKGKEI